MSRRLKDFINENRQVFDDEQPGDYNWERIAGSVPALKSDQSPFKLIYRWAAAAAILVTVAGLIFLLKTRPESSQIANEGPSSNDIRAIAPEYAASAEPIYQAIAKQQQQLRTLSEAQPQLYDQFIQDLATLDSSYRVLKAQAAKSANKEILIKAMMNNLQLQAELLSKQLNVLKEFNNNQNQTNDKEKNYSNL